MKLATLKDGSRDGQLVVVSRDLASAHFAQSIAPTLQGALDDWAFMAPQLEDLSLTLNAGRARHAFTVDPTQCMAPLPRAFQWLDGSTYVNHVELVRRARKAEMPQRFWHDPLMYQGGSDDFLGPCDEAVFASEDWGIDFEAELAVITDDVPMGASPEQCADHIRLLMLANDWSLRTLIPDEYRPCAVRKKLGCSWRRISGNWGDRCVHGIPVTAGVSACELWRRAPNISGNADCIPPRARRSRFHAGCRSSTPARPCR
jgi:fumarylacetoacetate (FAA) hydrolase